MKPTIKYLYNGEYHYATVKDIGDIAQLQTAVNTDLVGAINSLLGKVPDNLQTTIDSLNSEIETVKTSGLNEQELTELQGKITATETAIYSELNSRIAGVESKYDTQLSNITSDYDAKVASINTELGAVKTDLSATETALNDVGSRLSTAELGVSNVQDEVDYLNGEIVTKVSSTDFNALESTVSDNSTAITQNSDSIALKADQASLDLATGRITDAESQIEVNAQGITSAVKRDELRKDLDELDIYAPNILRNTRDWEGWTAVNPSQAYILADTYKHLHIQEQIGTGGYLEDIVGNLTIGETYTATVYAKSDGLNAQVEFLADGVRNAMSNDLGDVYLSTGWQRLSFSFVAGATEVVVAFAITGTVGGDISQLAGAKIELGSEHTGWQAHEDDEYGRLVSAESKITQHADQITSVVSKQEKTDDTVSSQQTAINQMSDSIELQAGEISDIEGRVTANEASISVNSDSISLKVEQTDIDKSVEGISLDTRNVVQNSDFSIDEMYGWSNVNNSFVVETIGDKNFLTINRGGLTSDLIASATSSKFAVEEGDRLSIGLDVIIEDLNAYDNQTVAVLDMYDINDIKVDFKEFNLTEFSGAVESGKLSRITTRYSISRPDVDKADLKLTLYRNGKISYTNITIQKGDIKSVGWMPAPEDSQLIQSSLKTAIDQNASSILLKAESSTVDGISGRLDSAESSIQVNADSIASNVKSLEGVGSTLSAHESSIEQNASAITSKVSSTDVNDILAGKGYATQSEVEQTANSITSTVSSVSDRVGVVEKEVDSVRHDTVDTVSGEPPIVSHLTQAEGSVYVEIDGQSEQEVVEGNPNLFSPRLFVQNNTSGHYSIAENGNLTISGIDSTPNDLFTKIADLKPDTEYIMTFSEAMNNRFELRNSNGDVALDKGWSRSDDGKRIGVTTGGDTAYMVGKFYPISQDYPRTVTVKVEEGSTATPIPKPSPDYPSEIKSLDKSFDVVSSIGGRNYLRNDKWYGYGSYNTTPEVSNNGALITFTRNETGGRLAIGQSGGLPYGENIVYTLSGIAKINGQPITNSVWTLGRASTYQGETLNFYIDDSTGYFEITQKWTDSSTWVLHGGSIMNGSSGDVITIEKFTVNKSNRATPYSQAPEDIQYNTPTDTLYKTNILLSEPLRSVGDVKDRLFRDSDGLWKVERSVGETELDGSEGWNTEREHWWIPVSSFDGAVSFSYETSHFRFERDIYDDGHSEGFRFGGQSGDNHNGNIIFYMPRFANSSEFTNWLTNNPVTVVYEIANPTTETLSDDIQQKLNNLYTFKDQTYVYTIDNSGVTPTLHGEFKSSNYARNRRTVTNLDSLENTTLPALEDGLLNKAEKEAVRQALKVVESDKTGIDSQYTSVYNNSSLLDPAKKGLYNAKVDYNTAYGNLYASIQAVLNVADGTRITHTQIDSVESKFGLYGNALAVMRQKFEEALDFITGKKADDSSKKAVDDLEFGGRNLVSNTKSLDGFPYKTDETYKGFNIAKTTNGSSGYVDTISTRLLDVPNESEYIVSFYAKSDMDNAQIRCYFYNPNTTASSYTSTGYSGTGSDGTALLSLTTEWKKYWVKWTQGETTGKKWLIVGRNMSANATVEIAGVMLEKGNKASDWSPAPEDVDASINSVKTSVDTLEETTLPALEDGMLNKAEKESVRQALKIVESDKKGVDSQYTSVFNNSSLLDPAKNNLYNAKGNYDSSYNNLKSAIDTVLNVSDGTRITQAQIDNVENKFTDYGNKLAVVRQRFEEALDAISGKKIDDVEIGGRNLFAISSLESGHLLVDGGVGTNSHGEKTSPHIDVLGVKNVSFSYYTVPTSTYKWYGYQFYDANKTPVTDRPSIHLTGTEGSSETFTGTIDVPENAVYMRFSARWLSDSLCKVKLEKGNKITDYTLAPEDVALEQNKKTYLPVRYIRDWSNGSTANDGNHKYEIQAYANGENVAKGKPVTTNGNSPNNLSILTDGITTTGSYASAGNSTTAPFYMEIDLGKVYYNIDSIGVWRYYNDNRTYHDTKTEVSPDGSTWYSVFDSFLEGEYPETSEGKVFKNTWAKHEGLTGSMSRIRQLADEIDISVKKDNIIGAINLSIDGNESNATINADRINLQGAVTISSFGTGLKSDFDAKASKTDVTNAVDDIEIGGRNLILESQEERIRASAGFITWELSPYFEGGEHYITIEYTQDKSVGGGIGLGTSGYYDGHYDAYPSFNIGKNTYKAKINLTKETGNTHFCLYVNTAITISRIKLEKGNKPTDYTPAPEDFENKINNAVTTIDGTGVTVKDGSFFLRDSSNPESKFVVPTKQNYVKDGAFTTVEITELLDDGNYGFTNIDQNTRRGKIDSLRYWSKVGSPYSVARELYYNFTGAEVIGQSDYTDAVFGDNSPSVNNTNYLKQLVTLKQGVKYTISAHFMRQFTLSVGKPRLVVRDINSNVIASSTFSDVPSDYSLTRKTLTFTVSGGDSVYVEVLAGDTNYVIVDGVQLVEGAHASTYVPDYEYYQLINGGHVSNLSASLVESNRFKLKNATSKFVYTYKPTANATLWSDWNALSFGWNPEGDSYSPELVINEISEHSFYAPADGRTRIATNLKVDGNVYTGSKMAMGEGSTDGYVRNSVSGKYLQLKDNGMLTYSNAEIFNQGEDIRMGDYKSFTSDSKPRRDKIRVWGSSTYTIGMGDGYTFGYLNDYAMTFQMNSDSDRGFWWGDSSDTNSDGAMSLTTDGRLYTKGESALNEGRFHVRSNGCIDTYTYTGSNVGSINSDNGSENRWNNRDKASLFLKNSNNALAFFVGGTQNGRQSMIQGGHSEDGFAQYHSSLFINKLGGTTYIGSGLSVSGSKNAIHVTRDGFRATPAYEMAESYLGDMGSDITNEDNRVKVMIDTLFGDTVNTADYEYHVFLQSHSRAHVWVSERSENYFIVESDLPDAKFSWELKAKRRGYEKDRLVLDKELDYADIQNMSELSGNKVEEDENAQEMK